MRHPLSRRDALLAIAVAPFLKPEGRSREQNVQIFEAVWENARDLFYDPRMRGVDWLAVRKEFLPQAAACRSGDQLLSLLRDMLGRLRNSHIFLYSREEWSLRKNILPFFFDRVDGRVFVRYVLRSPDSAALAALEFGDEVMSVDGISAQQLRPLTLARLEPIKGNPNFGAPASVAKVEIRRGGRQLLVEATRVERPSGFECAVLSFPKPDIALLRLSSLESGELPASRLLRIWNDVTSRRGLILDLRNCVGGDSELSTFIASSLLGPGKRLFLTIPRPGIPNLKAAEIQDETGSQPPRFNGRVALITNSNTESQPEVLAAICKEYGCAKLIGEPTAGAFNGWTIAVDLPDQFAMFALPYTRSVSPKGIDYEGRGVAPDEPAANTVEDFRLGRDRPLEAALRCLDL